MLWGLRLPRGCCGWSKVGRGRGRHRQTDDWGTPVNHVRLTLQNVVQFKWLMPRTKALPKWIEVKTCLVRLGEVRWGSVRFSSVHNAGTHSIEFNYKSVVQLGFRFHFDCCSQVIFQYFLNSPGITILAELCSLLFPFASLSLTLSLSTELRFSIIVFNLTVRKLHN